MGIKVGGKALKVLFSMDENGMALTRTELNSIHEYIYKNI
jgi:hypothetical protein